MRAKIAAMTLALFVVPGLAFAGGCSGFHDQVTMSCPEGQMLDAETGVCVPLITS